MITKEQLLVEKLENIYSMANNAKIEKDFYIAIYEYLDLFYTNQQLNKAQESLIDEENIDCKKYKELYADSLREIDLAFIKVKLYLQKNNINNEDIANKLKDYKNYIDGRKRSSNNILTELYDITTSILYFLICDNTYDHESFVSQFATITSDGTERRIRWTYSPGFFKWQDESNLLDRLKLTKSWYSWQRLDLFYKVYRDYEAMKDSFIKGAGKGLDAMGLALYFGELKAILKKNNGSRIFFLFADDKIHLQRLHQYVREKMIDCKANDLDNNKSRLNKIKLDSKKVRFDNISGVIIIGDQNVRLPLYKDEYDLCKDMFKKKLRLPVSWDIIYDKMTGKNLISGGKKLDAIRKNWQKVNDAMKRVNNRVRKEINTDDNLFSWNNKTVIRNF
jgi:hypothetical protein